LAKKLASCKHETGVAHNGMISVFIGIIGRHTDLTLPQLSVDYTHCSYFKNEARFSCLNGTYCGLMAPEKTWVHIPAVRLSSTYSFSLYLLHLPPTAVLIFLFNVQVQRNNFIF
jgi:hypothetical protein